MKVSFVTNLPSPYRVDFFNELSKYCELTVLFERQSALVRDEKWTNKDIRHYKEIFCQAKNIGEDKSIGLDLVRQFKRIQSDVLFITGYASPSVMILIKYCQRKRIKYYIETDGGFYLKDRFWKKIIKHSLLLKAEGIFTTCDELVNYYKDFGYSGKIIKYPFSSVRENEIIDNPISNSEKALIRAKLGINEKHIIISVGRFSYLNGYGKGYDAILRSANNLKAKDIGWYIIGGKPTDEFIQMTNNMNLNNVHYIDFKTKSELREYYLASDIFVLMTIKDVWGLVINEAMACGLPVITTNKCIAGIELIENEINGFVINVGDSDELSDKVNYLIEKTSLISTMSKNNIEKIHNWTIESMARKHSDYLENGV